MGPDGSAYLPRRPCARVGDIITRPSIRENTVSTHQPSRLMAPDGSIGFGMWRINHVSVSHPQVGRSPVDSRLAQKISDWQKSQKSAEYSSWKATKSPRL